MIKQKGVTLIEMLIAVAIIGVLTAIAYPSYQGHVLKGHRTQAMGDLIKIQLALEEDYTKNKKYELTIANDCEFCDSDITRYKLTAVSHASGYEILATPSKSGPQKNDECKTLSIYANGKTSAAKSSCW